MFDSLNCCIPSRLLWHIFTFANGVDCSSIGKGTPPSQHCIWRVITRSTRDKAERTALQIAQAFALRLRLATQRHNFRRVFLRERSATSRKGFQLFIRVPPRYVAHLALSASGTSTDAAALPQGCRPGMPYRLDRRQEVSRDETPELSLGNRQRTSIVRWCFPAFVRALRGGPERRVIPGSL